MACSFPSHNLHEVFSALISMIDQPKQTVASLMKYIKGPDFPTKGIILNSKTELRRAYETGSGAVKIRGEWKIENLPRGKKQIIITSIPYAINKARLIEKIAEITSRLVVNRAALKTRPTEIQPWVDRFREVADAA